MNALTGTEKQITWATDIRTELVRRINEDCESSAWNDQDSGNAEAEALTREMYRLAVEWVLAKTDAAWFIEYRKLAGDSLVDRARKADPVIEAVRLARNAALRARE